jgi:hypothetical protein
MGIKENLQNTETWKRGLLILLFALIYILAQFVVLVVVLFQFVHKVVTGEPQKALMSFCQDLSAFVYRILLYGTFASNEKPYPLSESGDKFSTAGASGSKTPP